MDCSATNSWIIFVVTTLLSATQACNENGATTVDDNTVNGGSSQRPANSGGSTQTSVASGGKSATAQTGGKSSQMPTGGSTATITTASTGGVTLSTGGSRATGGSSAVTSSTTKNVGGTATTGGSSNVATGGTGAGTGGSLATGGAATGGVKATGGAPATGGAQSTNCTSGLSGSPNPGSAAFTWYFFGQGTYMANGKYQTACGYQGTEPTKNGQQSVDNVANIANSAYFVAIPGKSSSDFTNVSKCGACIKITNGGKSSIATVIDECPIDSNPNCSKTGALDLSTQLFNSLGYSVGNPSGTTWSFVPCPVKGNVVVRFKPNNNNQEIYIENTILAVTNVTASSGGSATRTSYGTWHFGSALSTGASLTITDSAGRSITWPIAATTADSNQDTGMQFPACS